MNLPRLHTTWSQFGLGGWEKESEPNGLPVRSVRAGFSVLRVALHLTHHSLFVRVCVTWRNGSATVISHHSLRPSRQKNTSSSMTIYNFSSWPFLCPSRYFSLSRDKVATLQAAIPLAGCARLGQASRLGFSSLAIRRELR